jgi:hypothetical protein
MDRIDEREAAYRELREQMKVFMKRVMDGDVKSEKEVEILPQMIKMYAQLVD